MVSFDGGQVGLKVHGSGFRVVTGMESRFRV